MKKSFMTRVLAVSLSTAMAFSVSSASNLVTASAASTVNLKTTFKTLKVGQKYKLTLKKNTLNWKITKVTTSNKKICTVYDKKASSVMLKGKGVGRAKIKVKVKTTKRKYPKNIKTMTCTANVKAASENPGTTTEEFKVTNAAANSVTEFRVLFNQAIDNPDIANFAVSDNVKVTEAKLSDDKKSVLLTVVGAEYGHTYELTVSGIKVAGKEQAEQKISVTTPAVTDEYTKTLVPEKDILKSDGQTQTVVTFTLKDKEGNLVTDKGIEVAFTASLGKFAEQRVSMQNGVAKVLYTSEALMEEQSAAITATIVESTDNQKLMGISETSSIKLTPNPDIFDDTAIGAIITSATAPTADRVIAYFNKDVDAANFKTPSGKLNKDKFVCNIYSGIDNGWTQTGYTEKLEVVGVLPVPGEKNALQLLVDKPMMDNSNVMVEFENRTGSNTSVVAKNTVYLKLADAHQPSVLNVESEGQRKITVTFSEAVLPTILASNNGANIFAADRLENYSINGISLTDDRWKISRSNPETEDPDSSDVNLKKLSEKDDTWTADAEDAGKIQVGSYKDSNDNRHKVTIELGGDGLQPGSYNLEVSNVGDWAANTDKERNIVNTNSFQFEVPSDDSAPSFTVEEQSPEQYVLKGTSALKVVDNGSFKTPNSGTDATPLELQERIGNTWVTISDSVGGVTGDGKNPIRVSKVKDTNDYVVEVRRDWTEVYNTSSTRANYFNRELRLYIGAGKLRNPANNKLNSEIILPLNGTIMKTPDGKSPEFVSVEEAEDTKGNMTGTYNVTFDEPVKISDGTRADGKTGANQEGLTPNQQQQANATNENEMGVPRPYAQFIKADNSETIDGIITDKEFIDAYDKVINVAPESSLSAGKWTLRISSVSDDFGLTAASTEKSFDVIREAENTDFRIVWAAVSQSGDYDNADIGKGRGRYIFVKFNKPVQMAGNTVSAGVTANYLINGHTMPTGTKIRANIKNYDDHDNITDSVTIMLPEGNVNTGSSELYTVDAKDSMLTVSEQITSVSGDKLANGGMKRIPFQYGCGDDQNASDYISSLRPETDAVFGNHPSEQYDSTKGLKDYYQKLKNALEDEKYRRIILDQDIDLTVISDGNAAQKDAVSVFGRSRTLNIKRAVDLDLNGKTINGNVVVSTTNTVNEMKFYSATDAFINGYKDNKKGVATLTVNAPYADFVLDNVTVNKGGDGNAVNINDTWVNTFKNSGTINGDIQITDPNGAGIENVASGSVGTINGEININTSSDVNLKGNFTGKTIHINQAGKVTFGAEAQCDISNAKIFARAANGRIILKKGFVTANGAQLVAVATNVRVEVADDVISTMTFIEDQGKFVRVNDKNQDISFPADTVKDGGMKLAVQKLNVITGALDMTGTDLNTTTSAAIAISTGSIKIDNVKDTIVENLYTELTTNTNGLYTESTLAKKDIKVDYKLLTTNILESVNNEIKIKGTPATSGSDRIRVIITVNGYSMTKTVDVTP